MKEIDFYIVDVFAEKRYAGNQLAVFRGAADLGAEDMQQMAKEINFSESTFILSDKKRNGGYDVRIFTPNEEVPFAGHPTLGTAYILAKEIAGMEAGSISLNLKVGVIPVTVGSADGKDGGMLWMVQRPPVFGAIHDASVLADVLGIDVRDIDTRYPVQEVSTGLPAVMVPLRTLESVKRIKVDRTRYDRFVEGIESKAVLAFSPGAYEDGHDLNARVFVDYFGIPEDPATGSACGALAGYLAVNRYFGGSRIDIRVEQGYEINRPSLLYLRAEVTAECVNVEVGGKVRPVAKGSWHIG